ncbi:MAG: kelch repeat-containing protein, partial [Bacteroidota bacterium]
MKKYLLLSLCAVAFMSNVIAQQYAWVQRSDFAAGPRYASSYFTIGNSGYVCSGITHVSTTYFYHTDLWEYNPSTDVWTQKANLPAAGRSGGSGFAINGKGYVTLGWSPAQMNDLWEYDPATNSWTQKTNFAGPARYTASQFVIGNYAYVGTGYLPYMKDFWKYDVVTDSWTQIADVGAIARQAARGFALNNYGYVVTGGQQNTTYVKDLWRYDTTSNTWMEMSDFPGAVRSSPAVFTMNGKAFAGCGADGTTLYNDFYSYDPVNDTWTAEPSFPGQGRLEQFTFSFANRGFVGTGSDSYYPAGTDLSELWELVDITGINETASSNFSVTPTVSDGSVVFNFSKALSQNYIVSIFDASGKMIVRQSFLKNDLSSSVSLHDSAKGIYIYTITAANNTIKAGRFKVGSSN